MISVIIPVGPLDLHIEKCLEALYTSSKSSLQVIVVFDGWNKHLPEPPNGWDLQSFSVTKRGPAACRNFGAHKSRNKYICFLDSDVEIHKGALENGCYFIESQNINGVIGSYDDSPQDESTVSKFRNLLHHFHHQQNHQQKGVFWGAFTIIERSAFNQVEGFDENYTKPSIEDIELGYRLHAEGFTVVINSELLIKHKKKWTFPNMIYTDTYLRAKPWTILLNNLKLWDNSILNTNKKEKASALLSLSIITFSILSLVNLIFITFVILAFSIFIALQYKLYAFFKNKFPVYKLPFIFILHITYFLSAIAGYTLGTLQIFTPEAR